MPDANDMDLVREFATQQSEAAFAELVRRHVNLVYSIARRCTGSESDAEDVTQAVFVILARKAAGLRARTVVAGWLAETTRHTAACVQRGHARRHAREQEAYMQSTLTDADTAEAWARLAPHLEAGMAQLGERDRTLLTLRFYENKSGPEAAALLGIQEAAAHKRTARALEKLRKFFTRRGVALSATVIAGAVTANSVQAAPAGLAVKISVIATHGAAMTTAITSLVKGTMKTMTWMKIKLGALNALGLIGVATTLAVISNLHGREIHPSRPASLLEIQQIFDLATATKPNRCQFEADIESITPPYTKEQVAAELAQNEKVLLEHGAHLAQPRRGGGETGQADDMTPWRIFQSNAIVKATSGKRTQHVREWYSGNYYRLDINDEVAGADAFMKTHPNEYFTTCVNIPDSPFSPFASYEIHRQSHDINVYKQIAKWFQQFHLWQALTMDPGGAAGVFVYAVINQHDQSLLPQHSDNFFGLKIDPARVQQLHAQTDPKWRLEATDEELAGQAVTHFTLTWSFTIPPSAPSKIARDSSQPEIQAEIWVGHILGKAVCLQELVNLKRVHESTVVKREQYDNAGFPTVLTTTTTNDSSFTKQRVVFKRIEIHPSFTDEEAFAPVFPTNYFVTDLSSGNGIILQHPHPEISIRKK